MAKKKTFSFAHLIGRGATASEEEEDKKAKKAKGRRAEEDEREDDAGDDEREDDAENDDRDDDAEDDGDDPDAAEDDDDSEDDGDDDRKESKAVKNARAAERKRCARIFGSKHAAANPALAASLAFNTGMSSATAIDVLASTAPASQPQSARKRTLDQRMQESHNVRLGQDGENRPGGKSALVSKMTSLYNSTKGEK
ncbi:hypothetical protein [Klebsiella variicola]|uniref:hypothetical protein n=1 Tax=Klebsiella variicola TaxID=244366 RepID=UPI0013D7C5FA|nr:hypothetical protein [Klebsiella variicola]